MNCTSNVSTPTQPPSVSTPIPEVGPVSRAEFDAIVLAGRPVVFRGLVADWPLVRAGRAGPGPLVDYLKRLDPGTPVVASFGPPRIKGRFFYDRDLNGLNFDRAPVTLSAALDVMLDYVGLSPAPAVAVQSIPVRKHLPGLEADNATNLLDPSIEPRVWIGNAVTIAAHHDPSENLACVAAGRRRFTLFPPDQVENLYMGPFEVTPAGPTVSMVDFDDPDLNRHPRFADALDHALSADLEPGDAIYIPYLWWHHVRSTESLNMLVNYWWAPQPAELGRPLDAMFHAMVSIRDLNPAQRDAWRAMFDHYVFVRNGPVADHLPPRRRGVLGAMTPAGLGDFWSRLAGALGR